MKRAKNHTRTKATTRAKANKPLLQDKTAPFMEHVHELRRRLFYIALSVFVWSAAAYAVERKLVAILLRPAKNQQFIYTSPGGGIDFLFRVCVYVGIMVSIPVIVYQVLKYIQPLLKRDSVSFITAGSVVSGVLAVAGILYGYFWGLPSALNFLLHQFVTTQIKPLVTIQAYMSFVTVYMLGSAMLFQVPLIIIFINRIKPLKPKTLFKYEKHVAIFAVLAAALMNPTPNVLAQAFIAGPIILMYQVGILIVWATNRSRIRQRPPKIQALLEQDVAAQIARQEVARSARPLALATGANQPGRSAQSARSATLATAKPAKVVLGQPVQQKTTAQPMHVQAKTQPLAPQPSGPPSPRKHLMQATRRMYGDIMPARRSTYNEA